MLVLLNLHFPYCKGLGGLSLLPIAPYEKFSAGAFREARRTQICPNDQQMNTYLGIISTVEDTVRQMMK